MKVNVLGCGNILASDEGAGIHVVRKINKFRFPSEVKIFEVGRPGASLLDFLLGAEILIIIDAIITGGKPGSIIKYDTDEYTPQELFALSIHGFNLINTYDSGMKQFPDIMPSKLILYGIEVKERGKFSAELSIPIKKSVNRLVRDLKKEILLVYQKEN
ncbi:MAG: hydrogenase maturation protease [Candidatus Contubernalis sp.]|nr:hydrogenase maturation protease [Candidatus Contubernalis sp.]